MSEAPKPRKKSSVKHTRAIQRDRSKQPLREPPPEEIETLLEQLVSPIVYSQCASYQAMGLRQRILTLPVMVAFVLSLLWRQAGSVTEVVRELNKRGILWAQPTIVSQQAVSERLRVLPAELFRRVLLEVLPQLHARWQVRVRPLNAVVGRAVAQFGAVWILDGSALDALLHKVGLLREEDGKVLAGRMGCLLNAASWLPEQVWYEENGMAQDHVFRERALEQLPPGGLLLFDLGMLDHAWFDAFTEKLRFFVTRCKSTSVFQVEQVLHASAHVQDRLIWLGDRKHRCQHRLRLVEVEYQGRWFRYLTNVLDPQQLSALDVANLYRQRWRIEDAFLITKSLLGLAFFWVGSINGVQVQVWMTWLFYALLVDLSDCIADALNRPFEDISIEMVFKGLYHFVQEKKLGRASDPVAFLAQEAQFYGILKRRSHSNSPLTPLLDP